MSGGSHEVSASTSSSLLSRVKERDPEAWRQFVYLYSPLVYCWSRRYGVKPQDAADVSQEVFSAVSTGIARFRHDRPDDRFRGWLWTITRNKIRDHFRFRANVPDARGGGETLQRLSEIPDESSDLSENEFGGNNPLRRALELIRGEFRDHTWKAFWEVTVEQRATRDVAMDLGITVNAVRKAKSRVLARLRELLAGLGEIM